MATAIHLAKTKHYILQEHLNFTINAKEGEFNPIMKEYVGHITFTKPVGNLLTFLYVCCM